MSEQQLKTWQVKLYAEGAATVEVQAVDEWDAGDVARDILYEDDGGAMRWEVESAVEQNYG